MYLGEIQHNSEQKGGEDLKIYVFVTPRPLILCPLD